jgi:phage shock protein A
MRYRVMKELGDSDFPPGSIVDLDEVSWSPNRVERLVEQRYLAVPEEDAAAADRAAAERRASLEAEVERLTARVAELEDAVGHLTDQNEKLAAELAACRAAIDATSADTSGTEAASGEGEVSTGDDSAAPDSAADAAPPAETKTRTSGKKG